MSGVGRSDDLVYRPPPYNFNWNSPWDLQKRQKSKLTTTCYYYALLLSHRKFFYITILPGRMFESPVEICNVPFTP